MSMRYLFVLIFYFLLAGSLFGQKVVKGKIFSKEGGVKGVVVTDGKNFTTTSVNGLFHLNTDGNQKFIYYTLPSGYESPVENGVPLFYKRIDANSDTYNFEINKLVDSQKKHTFVVWADPQVSELAEFNLLDTVVDDIVEFRNEDKSYWHGISCGDMVFDHLNLFVNYKETVSKIPFPFYQVVGNHDLDYSNVTNSSSTISFQQHFGPDYYSYNVGDIHYVMLNDLFYYGYKYHYMGYLDQYQLDWLKRDLSYVKKAATVVIALHIPSMYKDKDTSPDMETRQKNSIINNQAFYDCLMGYNVHILAGHSHTQWNTIINDSIFEHTHAAVSAAWWQGEVGTDGTPKGYTIYQVDGNSISWYFKGVGKTKEYQFKVYPVGTDKEYPESFIANVFNYDPEWIIEWAEDGVIKGTMEQYWGVDPLAGELYQANKNSKYNWLSYTYTDHLFKAVPFNKSAQIEIIITDRFGKNYVQKINNEHINTN